MAAPYVTATLSIVSSANPGARRNPAYLEYLLKAYALPLHAAGGAWW